MSLLDCLKGIAEGALGIGGPSTILTGPRGVYKGPPVAPEKCYRCGSTNISTFGSFDSDNCKIEGIYCPDCGYHDSYTIA